MNIALVNICVRPYLDKAYFPTGLAYVATALNNAGYAFDLIDIEANRFTDQEIETRLGNKNYKVIAFGAMVSGYKYVKKLAELARATNPDAVLVAGNSVASSIPHHLLTHTPVDVAVKGEGELTMVNLVKAIEKDLLLTSVKGIYTFIDNQMVDTGYEDIIEDVDSIPLPDWDLFDMKVYLEKAKQDIAEPSPLPKDALNAFIVNTARGCPFHCTFCYHVFQYTKYRYRSPESILHEIRTLQDRYGINYINFFDELTFFTKDQAERFADAVLASGLIFFWNADIRGNLFTEKDLGLLGKLKASGALSFGYSLESANTEILKAMNKNVTVKQFSDQKHALDKAGITTFTSLVLGYPQETLSSIKETFDVCYDLGIYPSAGYLLPQPGTPMFEIARKKRYVDDLETYLLQMGDRQDLRFNLTGIPDDVFQNEVNGHLKRISRKIGLDLDEDHLIKTYNFYATKEDTEKNRS